MGIKCFLLSLGEVYVEPLIIPIVNYMPEEQTWLGTIWARCMQAKRHALGFSDISYYFMVMPLLFSHAMAREKDIADLRKVWRMAVSGTGLIIKLVNLHAAMAVLAAYSVISLILRFLMW